MRLEGGEVNVLHDRLCSRQTAKQSKGARSTMQVGDLGWVLPHPAPYSPRAGKIVVTARPGNGGCLNARILHSRHQGTVSQE
jgi:ribosomal protein S8E